MDFKSSLEQISQGEEEVLNKGADDMLIKHIINYFTNYLEPLMIDLNFQKEGIHQIFYPLISNEVS